MCWLNYTNMKTRKLFLSFLLFGSIFCLPTVVKAQSENIGLSVGIIRKPSGPFVPKIPINPPSASLDGHTFYINTGHADFVVQLLDEDDNVVYQTVMPSDVSSIVLPSTLSGTYQIQLLWGDWMFYGWINL